MRWLCRISNRLAKAVNRSILEGECIAIFRGAVRSSHTLDPYERRLVGFFSGIGKTCDEFVNLAKTSPATAERMIIEFVLKEKQRAEQRAIANGTINNTLKPIKLLLEMNDVVGVNWKKIKRLLPSARRFALDRIPTIDEIHKIIDHSDVRGKALTLVLCSSGIREGAIEYLTVRNLEPVKIDTVADVGGGAGRTLGKLTVYEGEVGEEYTTFITPEAYEAVQNYLNWRREHGETITDDSPLFRDKFDPLVTAYLTYGGGKPEEPKIMTGATIRVYYNRLFYECGFRTSPKRRHEFTVHGYRKWFKTRCENAGVKPIVTELLMGHSVGISDSYYRPTESDLLGEYLKAVDALTISNENRLKMQVEVLAATTRETEEMINTKMAEKDTELQLLRQREELNNDALAALSERLMELEAKFEQQRQR
jgi:integrase